MSANEQLDALAAGAIDIGFAHPPLGTGERLAVLELPAETSVAALPDDGGTGPVSLEQIAACGLILFPPAQGPVLHARIMDSFTNAGIEVQVVQVGPAVFVTNPAEYFCQYGLDIKKGSGFPFTFPVSLANGCVGYVPTEEAFGEHGGGYETRLTSYSNLEITAGNQMRDAGIELAKQLKPGATPEAPRRPVFKGKPWPYGFVAPQVR